MNLPSDEAAERTVAGSLVLEPTLYGEVAVIVRPDDFYYAVPRSIFEAVGTLVTQGAPVDHVSVAGQLATARPNVQAAAPLAVEQVTSAVSMPSSAPHHARTVARLAANRRVILAASDVIEKAQSGTQGPNEIVADAASALQDAPRIAGDEESPSEMADLSLEEIEQEAIITPHVPTGLPGLDRMLGGGLAGSRLYIVGARTSVGKSAFAANVARRALDAGQETLIVSLEMTGREILTRLMADAFNVDPSDTSELVRAMSSDYTHSWPLRFLGFADLSAIGAAVYRHRPKLLIVDYIQLIQTNVRFERRDLEVAHITRSLKLMAVRAGIPVLACAQVNRAPVKDKRPPRLGDLRESGAQEMDADVVILLDRDVDEASPEAKLAVAKNRSGATGAIPLIFDAVHTRFRERARV